MPKKLKRKRAKITIGRTPDGKPIVRYAQGYSKKELEINKGELKRQYVGGERLQKVDALKTPASNRVIPLANPLVAMLKEKRGLPGMHILTAKNGGPVYQKGFVEHWNNLMIAVYKAAMDSPDKKIIEGKLLFRTQGH